MTKYPYFIIEKEEFKDSIVIYSITGFVRYYSQFDWLMKSKIRSN